MRKVITISFLLLLLVSCGNRRTSNRLREIEKNIYDSPGVAYSALSDLDTMSLGTRSLKAKYSLLKAFCITRLKVDTSDLNLILPAVQYYAKHGPDSCKMMSQYCMGWLCFYQNDWASSFFSAKEAEKYVQPETDPRFKTILYSLLGSVTGKVHHTDEWLNYSKLALAALATMALLLFRRKVRHQAETDRLESIAETARQVADLAQDDAAVKLRNDFPDLSDKDILFLCYLILRFHTSTSAVLTGDSKDNVRQKRHRFQAKIHSFSGPNADLYRLLFE